MDERDWNKHRFHEYHGPDHDTVQRILDGRNVNEESIGKVLKSLNFNRQGKPELTRNDVPNN